MSTTFTNSVLPEHNWTEPEKWAWEKVCIGEIADFNLRYHPQAVPKRAEDWLEDRIISVNFIETILFSEPYKTAMHRWGLRISGAWIKETIDFSNAKLTNIWWMDNCRFDELVNLSSMQLTEHLSFARSFFAKSFYLRSLQSKLGINMNGIAIIGELSMYYISLERNLSLGQLSEFTEVDMRGAKIKGNLDFGKTTVTENLEMIGVKIGGYFDLQGSKILKMLDMDGIAVEGDLYMRNGTQFKEVNLTGAVVKGQLSLKNTTVSGMLDMDGLTVFRDLFMGQGSQFQNINLTGAEIGGQLEMTGVSVTGCLDMNSLVVKRDLYMRGKDESDFAPDRKEDANFGNINLTGAEIGGELDMNGAIIGDTLDMSGLVVKRDLLMGYGARFKAINLTGAEIGAALDMTGSSIKEKLDLNGISIKRDLSIRKSLKQKDYNKDQFGDIDMIGASVGGNMNIGSGNFLGSIYLNNVSINNSLYMNKGAEFSKITMRSVKIGGQLDMTKIKVYNTIEMELVFVDKNVLFKEAEFASVDRLYDSTINGSLLTSSMKITGLDLSGTTIRDELQLGTPGKGPIWGKNSWLNLRNMEVSALVDAGKDSWPKELNLAGFSWSGLGSNWDSEYGSASNEIAARDAHWFIELLRKDKMYSPQSYLHFAEVFTKLGHAEKADSILYASKNRERKLAWKDRYVWKWAGLSLLCWTIGYGLGRRYFRSLIWAILFIFIGILVIGTVQTGKMHSASVVDKAGFSLDMLIPFFELNDKFKLDFGGWQVTYFYFHKLVGFILGSFVVAGLSGITKK